LYQLDSGRWKRNFPTGAPIHRSPKHVAFGEDFKTVVGGSDHGAVYVFDRKKGVQIQVLQHLDKGMVQTVTVREPAEGKYGADRLSDPQLEGKEHNRVRVVHHLG
jgi:hypothetical protein